MATSSKIRVMLSSRCNDEFPSGSGTTLSEIRAELKAEIESLDVAGRRFFEVWINEDAPPGGGTWDSWDTCIEAVKDCDILIVVSNGNAGWAKESGDIGICHAEMMTGLSTAPAKVRLIDLERVPIAEDAGGKRNKRFQEELDKQSLFRGGAVKSVSDLKKRVKEALHDAVLKLTQAGVRDAAKGKYHSGAALDWSRLDFTKRRDEMVRVLRDSILSRAAATEDSGDVILKMSGQDILVHCHAVPASLTVGPAREMVGQPFLRDHLAVPALKKNRGGPVHVIACHKTATETQATKLLGFPDATLVSAPFGVFVADPVQNVQFIFIVNCRDEDNTRYGVQRFFEWLSQTGEEHLLAKRAMARGRIVRAIHKEIA